MYERNAKLVIDSDSSSQSRRFRYNQIVADVLGMVDLAEHRYLLVEDRHSKILGIIETEDLLEKVASPDPVERRRWSEMPLESAISARLDAYSPQSSSLVGKNGTASADIAAIAISTVDDELAAFFLDKELYLRWSSVRKILEHALVDTVTSLPNRMVFQRRLTEEWHRLERSSISLCIILVDLDYFKSINDEFGHAIGDIVLREVAKTLQRQLRSYDLLVRYGGDEFAAVLTGCTASQLEIPIQRIQEGIRELVIKEHPDIPPLSLSIGAVMIRSQANVGTMDDLILAADDCLYKAKNHGRDCAYVADLTKPEIAAKLVGEDVVEDCPWSS